ncbi:UDP-N-acetylmuramoyl-tripeptide--D-alanyl-D-alanine ligase [Knoellia sinensis KCTC 19936]|uniref:UDP-N-acetylmuramoyl-tripeptide--D-alanyl-D-alanine ligase n=1 Tax=Knoellia sinensis KCTC 19936 TaxID=1385520 RepID=A0A0A0J8N5_9MICO|nr:UDP-N-acetylmuramoyl-tripeptide--D-alanyl-D-alanine ligase [Knoellia sinensis]KGN33114.1 UDP-N-acetylmuramoyl-tripeptide--D-alanyl-D-alanine ligase [Knoellia sinensis KCTC 19936]
MITLTLPEIADLTGGTLHGVDPSAQAPVISGAVVTDSREAEPGSLYVARIGEAMDGHQFVGGARDKGAVAALTSRTVDELPCVVVDDVQAAFVAISRAVLDRATDLTVIGITGSSGKTSTKDLLGTVLAATAPTIAPVGSYNSEVGVPLTVTRVTEETRFLVVEMGARGIGHVHYLTTIAPPQIGVVLNVGTAHVGEFGSRDAIAQAKGELVEALPAAGVAVLNADDPAVRSMAGRTGARVVLVGEAPDATVRAEDVAVGRDGRATFRAVTPKGDATIALSLVGRHHVGNALAVLAVALECGIPLATAATAIGSAGIVSRWRMEVTDRAGGVTVVNDAYNANPDSMRAALAALETMGEGRRTWAVLGSMLELGDESDADHAAIGVEAQRRGVDELVVVGETARPMAEVAPVPGTRIRWVADADAAESLLRAELAPPDVVLFKSSRDAGLRWLGDKLTESARATPDESSARTTTDHTIQEDTQ